MERPGLKCEHCGLPFALLMMGAVTQKEIDGLLDPFPAKCPMCEKEASYPKSSIQILVGVGRP